MEGLFAEKSYSTKILPPPPPPPSNYEQIDLTLKLSPCGQGTDEEKWLTRLSSISDEKSKRTMNNVCTEEDKWSSLPVSEEGERRLMRFGDLQTMRRVRTGKRLLLEKQRRRAAEEAEAAEAHKSILNTLPNSNSSSCSWNQDFAYTEGGASSNIQMTVLSSPSSFECPAKKLKHVDPIFLRKGGDAMNNVLRQMPGVTTTGDGPKGKRIEGLLYKYNKGGQACILCACHGSLLSPAQFVMHAGGKEVADPMKHITICSNSFYIQGDDGSAFNS